MAHNSLMNTSLRMVPHYKPFVTRLMSSLGRHKMYIDRNALCVNWRILRLVGTFKSDRAQISGNNNEDYLRKRNINNNNNNNSNKDNKNHNVLGPEPITENEITKEIHFYRDGSNNFKETTYIDVDSPYGPPLAILLLWLRPDKSVLQRLIGIYGSKGFDVVTVRLNRDQFLYPRREGGAIRTVANFLDYLNGTHRYRPYIVHGFSIGAYIYGEMMAQLSEQYAIYYTIVGNIKGCLWDSPVEFGIVAPVAGKALYPRNIVKRWFFERSVARHLSEHHRDSVDCWERSRDYFCRQKCKVPNLFFVSEKDLMSNPGSIETARNCMEQNGIPTYQKTWQDSKHLEHFTKHFDEYVHGMNLFFSLANLFPDPAGKFLSYSTNVHLTSMRLSKKAREIR